MGREILQFTKIPTSLQAPPSLKSAPAPKLTPPPSWAQLSTAPNAPPLPSMGRNYGGLLDRRYLIATLALRKGSCGAGKEWARLGGISYSMRAARKLGSFGPAQGTFLALMPQVAGDR